MINELRVNENSVVRKRLEKNHQIEITERNSHKGQVTYTVVIYLDGETIGRERNLMVDIGSQLRATGFEITSIIIERKNELDIDYLDYNVRFKNTSILNISSEFPLKDVQRIVLYAHNYLMISDKRNCILEKGRDNFKNKKLITATSYTKKGLSK